MAKKQKKLQKFSFKTNTAIPLADLVIETERMRMVSITERFAEDIFREFTADITRFMFPATPDAIEDTLLFIRSCKENIALGCEVVLIATDRIQGDFLGCVGLHGRDDSRKPELGLWFKQSVHGLGLGREAICALINWAESTLAIDAFRYPVDRANIPSRKIPESFGGIIVSEGYSETMDPDRVLDELLFEIPLQK
jgi:[ribosomal protein S5]-alanine N-acetyltransferase